MSATTSPDQHSALVAPYLMAERDVLIGSVTGGPPQRPGPLPPTGPTPQAALEDILAPALAQQPCLVTFSGGRDSSALLATALHVARRGGLGEPIAFTLRYPGVAGTDETSWQELVIGRLRPAAWERVEVAPVAADILGPVGTASLEAHGLLWPPTLHLATGWLDRARGATIITGEGGDDVFGPHRATPLRVLARLLRGHPSSLRPSLIRKMAEGAAPAPVRAALACRKMSRGGHLAWLHPPVRQRALQDLARQTTYERWSWADAVRSHPTSPGLVLGEANRTWLGAKYGARFVHPFLDPRFVDAVARDGGRLGYPGRTETMRRIFADLLPEALLSRSTKATFNAAYHGQATHEFAQRWDGTGVDAAVVDVDVLRSMWLADRVHAGTTALLQKAWLASHERRVTG